MVLVVLANQSSVSLEQKYAMSEFCFSFLLYPMSSNVIGIEARGFIFGPSIALGIGAKFVPLRKPGKLPGTLSWRSWNY